MIMEGSILPLIVIVAAILLLVVLFWYYIPLNLKIAANASGVDISLIELLLMRIRKVSPHTIVYSMIEAHKAGLETVTREDLEAHYMAGGNVQQVIRSMIKAKRDNLHLTFQMASTNDLAGHEIIKPEKKQQIEETNN